jgi:glucoamylase
VTNNTAVRARSGAHHLAQEKHTPKAAYRQADLTSLSPYMLMLMMRNITSEGFVLEDPSNHGSFSLPGCVVAAPSYPANTPGVDQDYVFNWVRDAAITALEIAAAGMPALPDGGVQALNDYVAFAAECQKNAAPTMGHACFTIGGQPRPWSEQNDGPGIQSIAMMQAFSQLSPDAQATARAVIAKNIDYMLGCYKDPTTNLWEEHVALSFFARAVHLRCFREFAANKLGIPVPSGVAEAIKWLEAAIADHWNGSVYLSMMAPEGGPGVSALAEDVGYDPNIDIVSAAVYGGIALSDTKLLATAGRMRAQWADSDSDALYPVNISDAERGVGPLLGRYPGDTYDGDVAHPVRGGHPWPLCTSNFAELYYKLAGEIVASGKVPLDDLSRDFFAQVGIGPKTTPAKASAALHEAADAMMRAVIFHSDRYELGEQYDGTTGYKKSVQDLTWSYAAFLSALRAKTTPVKKPVKAPAKAAAKAPAKAPAKASAKAPVKATRKG